MEDIRIDGLSADEWEALANPEQPTTEDLGSLGIIQEQSQPSPSPQEQQPQKAERDDYEDLGYWQTVGDEFKAAGIEATKFFVPKKYELNYTPRTKAGEAYQTFFKYLYGIGGLFVGGEFAAVGKAAAAAKGMTGAAKVAGGAEAVLKGNKFFKTGKGGLKALGVKALNIGTQGVTQGAIIDATIHDADEGRIVDLFGDTQNKFIDWLQTDENDSTAMAKFKNVVDGALFSIGINGVFSMAEPIIGKVLTNIKKLKKAQTPTEKEATDIAQEIFQDQTKLEKIAETSDIVQTVKEIRETADDPSEAIINTFHPDNIEDAQNILKMLDAGEDIAVHEDGTFAIKVSKWDDAYKVSADEYKRQLAELDQLKADTTGTANAGDTALEHQDEAVRHTWTNRGWIGAGEELNQKSANKITKNYKDKFKIDNNVKVEFVDGLTINGKAVEGNTSATTFIGKKSKKGTKPNITIQIDKNAKNPYATLRAELEHARDIAKGEVPDQAEKHFARYNGMNEGEVAADYVYKKSQGKAKAVELEKYQPIDKKELDNYKVESHNNDAFGENPDIVESDYKPYTIHNIKDAQGNNLAHIEITDGNYINWRVNHRKEQGAGRKLIAKLLYENKYKTLIWDATTENSVKSYERFCREFPDLVDRIEYSDKYTKMIDINPSSPYNSEKGVINGKGSNQLSEQQPILEEGRGNKPVDSGQEGFTPQEGQEPIRNRSESSSNSPTNARGENSAGDIRSEQLKLDFNTKTTSAKTTEELVDGITNGNIKVNDAEDVNTLLNKFIELDKELSGTTWEDLAKIADKKADLMIVAEEAGLYNELKEAISLNDVEAMRAITTKALGIQRFSSNLAEKLAILGDNPPMEQMKPIIDMIDMIRRYTKATGSASGESLQARKFINKAVQAFGSLRLSELTKEGINTISDLLSVEINKLFDLNFTQGAKLTPQQMKQQLMEGLLQNTDSPFIQLLTDDKELATKFDSILDDLFKGNNHITSKNVYQKLEDAITEARYREVYNATKLAETPETKAKVIKNWCDAQGGLTSFYIHNLLSGVGTLAKNVISGGLNTVYFPAKKIIAGYLGGGEALRMEGWNTYKNLMSSWKESWSLGKQAFLNGEGNLSMMRDTMALADGEVFNGFREWNFDFSTKEGIWHAVQNFHSMMTRAMGASDEFMSQLNYRAITRAKALEKAEALAKQYNITDEAVKNNIADRIFKNAFDNAGKPLNVDALAEAKDILYQLPLNGQVFDRTTGEMKQVRPQTWTTQLAGGLNSGAAKNPLLKVMFPFVKTGANILQQNLDHNLLYMLASNKRNLLKANTKEGALARSQVAFGMFSFMTAAGLAISGAITGSAPSDQKERAALFETGWKPYSIRIGDKYVSYQGYEPIQTILGFAADSVNIYGNITNSEDEAKWEKFSQQVMATAINNFLDKAAFRTGLRQLAFMTSPDDNMDEFKKSLTQTAQGFLPDSSMVRSMSSIGNRNVTAPKSAYERIFNNYFNRGLGDYRRDVFGNRQDNVGLLVTNVTPDNASQPEYEEMEYLSQFGFSPSDISQTIKETTLKYTEFKDPETGRSVYDTMQEELSTIEIDGKTLQDAVRELVTSQEYQDLPLGVNMNGYKYSSSEATKLNAIRSIFVEYNNTALQNVIRDYGELYIDRRGRTMSEAIEEVNNEKLNTSINEGLEHNIGNQVKRFGQ